MLIALADNAECHDIPSSQLVSLVMEYSYYDSLCDVWYVEARRGKLLTHCLIWDLMKMLKIFNFPLSENFEYNGIWQIKKKWIANIAKEF